MGSSNFEFGMVIGIVLTLLACIFVWHIGESQCQREHNVADCVLSETPFVPAVNEEAVDD